MFTLLEKTEWQQLAGKLKKNQESQTGEAISKRLRRQENAAYKPCPKKANYKAKGGLNLLKDRSNAAIFNSTVCVRVSDTKGHSEEYPSQSFYRRGLSATDWWADKNEKNSSRYSSYYYSLGHHWYNRLYKEKMTKNVPMYVEIVSDKTGKIVDVVKVILEEKYAKGNYGRYEVF